MKLPFLPALALAGLTLATTSGCAFLTKGQKQTVIVRSTPSGATASINGTPVGTTPFQVKLKRDEVFRIDLEKNGFSSESAVVLPSSALYDQRFLRWGLDYQLGAATDLVPSELAIELKPELGESTGGDPYTEMAAQITRADAMLASGELTAADHKFLVSKIVATFHKN